MRAAQSKGIVDLLALWPDQSPWVLQCKYSIHGGGYLPASEAEELRALAEVTGCAAVFARPGKNGRGVEFVHLNERNT